MFEFRRGILGLTGLVALSLGASIGCSDDLSEEEAGGAGGTGAAGGAGGSSGGGAGGTGGAAPACKPTADVCYSAGPNGPGNECLAPRNNEGQDHMQIRAVWARSVAPKGNTTGTVYDILRLRSSLKWSECNMPNGQGGFMLLTDWDRSNPDKAQQTVRTGYATYFNPPEVDAAQVKNDGLCMAEYTLPESFDPFGALNLGSRAAELAPLAFPWAIKPDVAKRVLTDFDSKALYAQNPPAESQVFIDEEKGYIHGYAPLSWVTVLDSLTTGIAIPLRAFDIRSTFNDNKFNCAGRFRADALSVDSSCDSPAQTNPQWGCKDDAACPPAGYEETGTHGAGAGPNLVTGFFKIVDLERVFSAALGGTLCTTYPGVATAELIASGWAAQTTTGRNCRAATKWNPELPNDEGLPPGDWCSRTNAAASATCHDAWRSITYGAGQAFKVKAGTCPRGTL
jgi:hypothetical protein